MTNNIFNSFNDKISGTEPGPLVHQISLVQNDEDRQLTMSYRKESTDHESLSC